MPGPLAIPGQAVDFQLVWNLLFYDNAQQAQTDSQLFMSIVPPTPAVPQRTTQNIIVQSVQVIQFGTQSNGFWIMVTCSAVDPSSFSSRLALQFYISAKVLSFVNSTFIQDLEGLTIPGFFSNGSPLP